MGMVVVEMSKQSPQAGGGGVCVPELWGHQLIEHKLTALHLLMSSLPNCYVSFCFHLYVKKQCDAVK